MSHSEDLAAIKAAMKGCDWRLEAVLTLTHGVGVQVWAKDKKRGGGRYAKVGPLLITADDNTVDDTLAMLGAMAVDG